jgi:translation initiation factor 6 (eIF-6)
MDVGGNIGENFCSSEKICNRNGTGTFGCQTGQGIITHSRMSPEVVKMVRDILKFELFY